MPKNVASALAPLLVLALLSLAPGCGGDDEGGGGEAGAEAVEVELAEQNDSGQSGTATLEPAGEGMTRVTLELSDAPDAPQPVHIHSGSCEELGDVAYPLTNLEDGRSETTVEASLDELRNGDFAVNAHESEENIQTYVACGNIPDS